MNPNILSSKSSTFFECKICHYKCSKKFNLIKHCDTTKHLNNVQKIQNDTNSIIMSKNIINFASIYEYRLNKGRRDIIHIEGFIMNIISIIKNN
jgi:hypothetical protein